MKKSKVILMSLISLALASSSALANGDSHKTPSGIPPVEVRIEMGEFFFSPSLLNLVGGLPYIFRFVNIGKVAHEFDSPALVAISESEKVEVVSPGGKVIAQIYGVPDEIILAPGAQAVWHFTPRYSAQAGIVCDLPGHREAGMTGHFVVKAVKEGK